VFKAASTGPEHRQQRTPIAVSAAGVV